MSDLISRKMAIDAVNAYLGLSAVSRTIQNMTSIQEILENLPSAEPKTPSNGSITSINPENTHDRTMSDTISRQAAIDAVNKIAPVNTEYDCTLLDILDVRYVLTELPSAEPEWLTDDDFETIRIHLNAQKEKLCNQRRWEEAEEYQRIIDRFVEFASAEPERKTAEWIYGENGGQDGWYCSKCGLFIPWDYEYYGLDNIDFIADFHTCPKCDRKMLKYTGMRGEQE